LRGRKPSSVAISTSAALSAPKPPSWLSRDAKAEWKRVIPLLIERRILTEADMATFANYCLQIGRIIEAQRTIDAEGMFFDGTSGPKRHPAVGVQNDAATQARQLAAELGLTPVSRSRPAIRDDDARDDDDDLGLD